MKRIVLLTFIILIVIASIVGFIHYRRLQPNKKVIAYSDELYLIVEEQEVENENAVLFYEDILYFSLPTVKDFIDEDIFYDEGEEILIITNKEKVLRYKLDDSIATVNSKEFLTTNNIRKINEKIYIPIDIILKNYDVEINYFEDTNAVVLDYKDIIYLNGEIILDGAVIRSDLDIKAPIIAKDMAIGTILNVYAEYESWYKVRTIDGIPGFIEKKYFKINYTKDLFKVEKPIENNIEDISKKNINLTWDYTYRKVKSTEGIAPIVGINTISPTWFSINDEGNILDKGNIEYVKKYNDLGYEIWPLINNNFDPDLTHELLSESSTREKLIMDILELYKYYGFQGINIDFENVHLKTKDFLTQFVRELYPVFKEVGMSVSMDVTGISTAENWSLCYDRKRLSEAVDYMILMAYDQHWATSPVAGSVAEYYWVEKSILGVLEHIPNNKLILGVPFYTRLWIEKEGKVSSQALSMEMANKFISENNIDLTWDDKSLQYFGQMEKDGSMYKIWLEDPRSLEIKASLVHKYELAGLASWRKGFETANIWNSLDKVLN
ncbi:glycosyl hydrolase family 18 protein [Tissierella praeacuta]|uniref:glycosyl hydrolase family 18 protein n=1 Tax=Tissierella praeacuta TaxID=43131 RepID=UPI00334231A2